jgi:predicted lysophospholipase L1 biosynthesis ABC-type transport system permease subunit
VTVVGVAQNAARSDWAAPPAAEFYLPYLQSRMLRSDSEAHAAYLSFVVRAERDPAALVGPVRSAIRSSAPDVTLSEELLMRDVVAQATAGTRFLTALMGAFAAIAVLLAGVGIHGVMSYIVSGRRHEIGIRLALGASPRRVLVSVVGSGLTLAATGIAIGLVVAFGASGLVVGVVFGVPPTDARVFASVAAALFGIATVACVVPAWRASAVDPLGEIRQA